MAKGGCTDGPEGVTKPVPVPVAGKEGATLTGGSGICTGVGPAMPESS
jgi:hypothetical protein